MASSVRTSFRPVRKTGSVAMVWHTMLQTITIPSTPSPTPSSSARMYTRYGIRCTSASSLNPTSRADGFWLFTCTTTHRPVYIRGITIPTCTLCGESRQNTYLPASLGMSSHTFIRFYVATKHDGWHCGRTVKFICGSSLRRSAPKCVLRYVIQEMNLKGKICRTLSESLRKATTSQLSQEVMGSDRRRGYKASLRASLAADGRGDVTCYGEEGETLIMCDGNA